SVPVWGPSVVRLLLGGWSGWWGFELRLGGGGVPVHAAAVVRLRMRPERGCLAGDVESVPLAFPVRLRRGPVVGEPGRWLLAGSRGGGRRASVFLWVGSGRVGSGRGYRTGGRANFARTFANVRGCCGSVRPNISRTLRLFTLTGGPHALSRCLALRFDLLAGLLPVLPVVELEPAIALQPQPDRDEVAGVGDRACELVEHVGGDESVGELACGPGPGEG